jgi:uncharacterized delta-60 repeat protein
MMQFSKDPKIERGEIMLKQLLRSVLMLALLAIICASFPAAQAASGDLDTTFAGFGAGGVVTETGLSMIVPLYDPPNGMALQPDGKMVTVGFKGPNLLVFRYQPNGQRDGTFSGDGKIEVPAPEIAGSLFRPYDITFQPDGSIIVVGGIRLGDDDDDYDFLLVRLTAAGELDPSFGEGGFVTTNFNGNEDHAHAVLVQPNGAIVVCGEVEVDSIESEFGVARYLPNGSPDPTFSNDGRTTIGFRDDAICHNLALQSDGKLVLVGAGIDQPFVTGEGDFDFALARLESNGSLDDDSNDAGFGGDGKVLTNFGEDGRAWDVALQPDGKIVVLGNSAQHEGSTNDSYVARYLPNGALDETFGSGGKKTIPGDVLYALALQPDGKLLALGYHLNFSGEADFSFHRLLPSGAKDPTFGALENGDVRLSFGGDDVGKALALLPDGRILGFGWSGGSKLILARLWPHGTLDSGGKQTHAIAPGYYEAAYGLAVQPDGSLLVAGEVFTPPSFTVSNAFVTRFRPDGQVDTAFGVRGTIYPPYLFSQDFRGARAITVQPDGKIVMAGYSDVGSNFTADFLVARWHSNGAPDANFGVAGLGFRTVNFPGNGDDYGRALALAPDGKIVLAGSVWNGNHQVWGVARLTNTGTPDNTFDGDGLVVFGLGPNNALGAVAVQPDGKILVAGQIGGDFAVARLAENGSLDASFGQGGFAVNDLGGTDVINALALAANGWIYAAGYRVKNGNGDMALAQYTSEGVLAACPSGQTCNHWPTGTFFTDGGINDYAYALDIRGDNQLVAAGCINLHFAAVQVRTDGSPSPLAFNTDFGDYQDCARAVKFSGASRNKITLAGLQPINNESNIALARFETTENNPIPSPTPTPPPGSNVYPVYLPVIVR